MSASTSFHQTPLVCTDVRTVLICRIEQRELTGQQACSDLTEVLAECDRTQVLVLLCRSSTESTGWQACLLASWLSLLDPADEHRDPPTARLLGHRILRLPGTSAAAAYDCLLYHSPHCLPLARACILTNQAAL